MKVLVAALVALVLRATALALLIAFFTVGSMVALSGLSALDGPAMIAGDVSGCGDAPTVMASASPADAPATADSLGTPSTPCLVAK